MEKITMYKAINGRLFTTSEDCVQYEEYLQNLDHANEMFQNGATLMSALTRANQTEPNWGVHLAVEDAATLMRIRKETKIKIPHWQCKDYPEYHVVAINEGNRIMLSGSTYTDRCDLKDLLRYLRGQEIK